MPKKDYTIVLIGHADHDEVTGTMGEAPEHHAIDYNGRGCRTSRGSRPLKIVCLTQTTLSMDDTTVVIDALRNKFPALVLPGKISAMQRRTVSRPSRP